MWVGGKVMGFGKLNVGGDQKRLLKKETSETDS